MIGRYSLATVTPSIVTVHRLVQAVIQTRLDRSDQLRWAESAVNLVRASFPYEVWEVGTWTLCEQLLHHVIVVAEHAERLGVAGEPTGWLLERASAYLRERGQYRKLDHWSRAPWRLPKRHMEPTATTLRRVVWSSVAFSGRWVTCLVRALSSSKPCESPRRRSARTTQMLGKYEMTLA